MKKAQSMANYSSLDGTLTMEGGIPVSAILRVWETCCRLERNGNTGEYALRLHGREIMDLKRCKANADMIALRKTIMFYSRGWGWRLRKNPHWQETLKTKFPKTLEGKTYEESARD